MSSSIEIGTDELEAVELPPARSPSVRPGRSGGYRATFAGLDDEMTVVRLDKRVSTSPPPSSAVRMPRIPRNPVPRFDEPLFPHRRYADDEPTMLHPSSTSQRPLLSMTTPSQRTMFVEEEIRPSRAFEPPPSSRAVVVDEPPRSSVAVDAPASASSSLMPAAIDLSMTSSFSGSTDLRRMRSSGLARAALLVAVGVFGGLVAAVAVRGDGLSAVASLADPTHVSADVANGNAPTNVAAVQPLRPQAQAQAPIALKPGAAAPVVVTKPAAPSCNADAIAAPAAAKAEPKAEPKVVVEEVAAPAPKIVVVRPAPVVHHDAHVVRRVEHVERAAPAPVVHRAARHHDELDSANAADALAKAQLEAALSR